MTTATRPDAERQAVDAAGEPRVRGGDGDGGGRLGRQSRRLAVRLFLTAWIVYGLHFATDVVREHYPAVALGDDLTFRLDPYGGLHPDLFEKEGYGWHIGNNPGVSMLAAVPYALARPLIDPLVERVRAGRAASGAEPPAYDSPWPNERAFFREAWARGLDVKLGLAAFVTQAFFMAPLCALGVAVLFLLLRALSVDRRPATWLALLFAFGTPLFYRAAFLNHNMALGILTFIAFAAVWDPADAVGLGRRGRYGLLGLAGGTAVLFDYSGVVFLGGLWLYALARRWMEEEAGDRLRGTGWYALGALGPMAVLWFYQWRSFGHPFLPGQHWMPPVEWIDLGYQGYGAPQLELLWALAADYRFGLFTFCPLLLLALAAPFVNRGPGPWGPGRGRVPAREMVAILVLFLGLWVFFAGSNYTRLQFNTGVRYMTPIVPYLFVLAAVVLLRLPRALAWALGVASVAFTWSLAMYREVERPLGVLDPVLRTLIGGFELPVLRTLERTGGTYLPFAADGTSPLPLFVLAGAAIALIWTVGRPGSPSPVSDDPPLRGRDR